MDKRRSIAGEVVTPRQTRPSRARKPANQPPTFTIVGPVYNEAQTLPLFAERVKQVMEQLKQPWELLLVDDGSTDGSTEQIRQLAEADLRVRPVIFARNFGHQLAVTAGLDFSRGQAVIIMDTDLQDPPEVIPELVDRWREGFEVVYAVRAEREGESWFKKFTASLFYRLINRITDVQIPLDTGDFRLLDRKVVAVLNRMRERHRFPRAMAPGLPPCRALSTASVPGNQVPLSQDAAPGAECGHRVLVLSAAAGHLLWLRGRRAERPGHPAGHLHPFDRGTGTSRPGHHPDRSALPGRRAAHFPGDLGRVHRPAV
jgi:hypothetical protein